MTDLGYYSRTHATPDYSCIRTPEAWSKWHITAALEIATTTFADADAEDLYAPYDFIPVGTLLAFIATGAGPAYAGLWVPYLPNISSDNGEGTPDGILAAPAYFSRDQRGAVEGTRVQCAVIPAGTPCQVFASKMPEYNDHTAYAGGAGSSAAVTTGDLPSGFVNLDDYGVINIGSI